MRTKLIQARNVHAGDSLIIPAGSRRLAKHINTMAFEPEPPTVKFRLDGEQGYRVFPAAQKVRVRA